MPQGYYYNTWLTISQEVLNSAPVDGLCNAQCSRRFIPVLPSTTCPSNFRHDENCYPVLEEDVIFPIWQLRELEPPNNLGSGSTRTCTDPPAPDEPPDIDEECPSPPPPAGPPAPSIMNCDEAPLTPGVWYDNSTILVRGKPELMLFDGAGQGYVNGWCQNGITHLHRNPDTTSLTFETSGCCERDCANRGSHGCGGNNCGQGDGASRVEGSCCQQQIRMVMGAPEYEHLTTPRTWETGEEKVWCTRVDQTRCLMPPHGPMPDGCPGWCARQAMTNCDVRDAILMGDEVRCGYDANVGMCIMFAAADLDAHRVDMPRLWAGPAEWHLAPPGALTCDYGVVATEAQCHAAGIMLAAANGQTLRRGTLQVGTASGASSDCDPGWGTVPVGCSVQSGVNRYATYESDGTSWTRGWPYFETGQHTIGVRQRAEPARAALHIFTSSSAQAANRIRGRPPAPKA